MELERAGLNQQRRSRMPLLEPLALRCRRRCTQRPAGCGHLASCLQSRRLRRRVARGGRLRCLLLVLRRCLCRCLRRCLRGLPLRHETLELRLPLGRAALQLRHSRRLSRTPLGALLRQRRLHLHQPLRKLCCLTYRLSVRRVARCRRHR